VALADHDEELAALFDGTDYGPARIDSDEPRASPSLIPQWLDGHFAEPIKPDEKPAMLERASLDARVNSLKATRDAVLPAFPEAQPLALPDAFRLPIDFRLEDHAAYRDGQIEVQDYGSQLIVEACTVKPGMTVLARYGHQPQPA
jgi:16S rRNA (cytosine967-C5)-methyltransferase